MERDKPDYHERRFIFPPVETPLYDLSLPFETPYAQTTVRQITERARTNLLQGVPSLITVMGPPGAMKTTYIGELLAATAFELGRMQEEKTLPVGKVEETLRYVAWEDAQQIAQDQGFFNGRRGGTFVFRDHIIASLILEELALESLRRGGVTFMEVPAYLHRGELALLHLIEQPREVSTIANDGFQHEIISVHPTIDMIVHSIEIRRALERCRSVEEQVQVLQEQFNTITHANSIGRFPGGTPEGMRRFFHELMSEEMPEYVLDEDDLAVVKGLERAGVLEDIPRFFKYVRDFSPDRVAAVQSRPINKERTVHLYLNYLAHFNLYQKLTREEIEALIPLEKWKKLQEIYLNSH